MKFFALLIAAVAANQQDLQNLVALQAPTDTRQADGAVPFPQRMSGVNGSVAVVAPTAQRWTDAPLLKSSGSGESVAAGVQA